MEKIIPEIKKKSDELLDMLGFEGDSIVVFEDRAIIINYDVDSPALLIGKGGEGLLALQHVIRLLLADLLRDNEFDVVVDVSGYRKKKASNLTRTARDKAYQVLATGIPKIFAPMSAYERRIIHMTCANIADVETSSEGEGRERRVVIKPKKNK